MAPQTTGTSNTGANLVTILLLIFLLPVGIIVMWFWPKWQSWVKILMTVIAIPVFLFVFLPILAVVGIMALNPQAQINKAKELQQKQVELQQLQSPTPSASSTKKTK